MIYLLTGPNAYLLHKRLKELAGEAAIYFDGAEAAWDDVWHALSGVSLFGGEEQTVVLKDFATNTNIVHKLEKQITEVPSTSNLILVQPKLDKRMNLFKQIRQHATIEEFKDLKDFEVAGWVKKEIRERELKVTPNIAQTLVDRVGTDQQRLSMELNKLELIDGEIHERILESVVPQNPRDSIFDLLDEVAAGNSKQGINIYEDLRKAKQEAFYIVSMLGWHIYNVAAVVSSKRDSETEIAKQFGVSPYVVGKTKRAFANTSIGQVREMVVKIAQTDLTLKTRSIDKDALVKQLIIELSKN